MALAKWLVGDTMVVVDQFTPVNSTRGLPEVGARVIVWGEQDTAGIVRATLVVVQRPAGDLRQSDQFTGVLQKQIAGLWIVDQVAIRVNDQTTMLGSPEKGSLVWVVAGEAAGPGEDPLAVVIETIALSPDSVPVEFEGRVTLAPGGGWLVADTPVRVSEGTRFVGFPGPGKEAEVRALVDPSGIAEALLVREAGANEVTFGALVTGMTQGEDGTHYLDIVAFSDNAWTHPEDATLELAPGALIDEHRAVLRPGRWIDVRGRAEGAREFLADAVVVESLAPVAFEGRLEVDDANAAAIAWPLLDGRQLWFGSGNATAARALDELDVRVEGLLLGNGVVWVRNLKATGAQTR
jgi:hypothetical protein